MKIALTTASPDIQSEAAPRFGRGAYFIIVDSDTMAWNAHANPAVNASGGAGIQAAQFIVDQGAQVVISGNFGPNAFNALKAAGVAMFTYGSANTVAEAIELWKDKKLQAVETPGRSGR